MASSKEPLAKTDSRYWLRRVYRQDRGDHQERQYCVRIQFAGRRHFFPLTTDNKQQAATKARDIFLSFKSQGEHATLALFKDSPSVAPAPLATTEIETVGEFLTAARTTCSASPRTVEDYCRAFRWFVAGIFNLEGDNRRFDYRGGGREKWVAKIDGIKLIEVTPDRVKQWKRKYLKKAGTDPAKLRSAKNSLNSFMRQAKSLFSQIVLDSISLNLPFRSPFEKVPLRVPSIHQIPRWSSQHR